MENPEDSMMMDSSMEEDPLLITGDSILINENPELINDDSESVLINDDSESVLINEDTMMTEDSILEVDASYVGHEMDDSECEEVLSTSSSPRGNLPYSEDAEWKPDPSVPQGWLIREFLTRTGQKLEHIKSPEGIFFPGRRAAMEWMKEKGHRLEDIRLMQSRLKIKWIDNHPSVPPGWKTRKSKIKTNGGLTEMEWFLSPTGKMYRGKKSILKAIHTDPGCFTEDEIRKFKTVPVPIKKFSAEYNWNEEDSTVPPGWRSALVNMNSFGKMVETVRYLAPDGRFCSSRVDAIKYMIKDENIHIDDLEKMKSGLLADGWMTSDELPDGWYMKPDSGRGKRKEAHYNYLSPDMTYLRSTKAAVTHMMADPVSYSKEDIEKLQTKSRTEGNKLRPDKYNWIEGHETVPAGWKIRFVQCSNGLEREFLLAPDGSSYSGRKQALEFLKKSGGSSDDIRKLESGCKVVWTDDDPTLPPGWKSRISDIKAKTGKVIMQWFLNPDGKMFRGRKAALEEIQNCGMYSKDEVRKFKFVLPDNKKTNYSWNSQDPSVPEGWYTTIINMNSFGKIVRSKRFMAPDGRFCSSRDEAIKYMIKEGLYTDSEIEIMEAGYEDDMEETEIKTEGWEINTSGESNSVSPVKRKYESSDNEFSPVKKIKQEHDSNTEATNLFKVKMEPEEEDDYSPASLLKVEMKQETDKDKFTVEMTSSDDKDAVPKLKITKIRSEVVKEEPDVSEESCYRLKSGRLVSRLSASPEGPVIPKDEGWVDDDTSVPTGWRTKEYINRGGQKVKHVMSPEGTFFAGRKAALEHMESTEGVYSQEDIELMQSGLKMVWFEDDPTLPAGWKSRTTEIKTKTGSTAMYWYKSPDGKQFRGRKAALKFMESSKLCNAEDVRKFKSTQQSDKKFTKDYDWSEEDTSIPKGWKSTVIKMNSFGKIVPSTRFLAPDGRYCSNRIDAIRYILKEGIYPEEDLELMKKGLLQEGWLSDSKLPSGWLMKPRKDKGAEVTASYLYLDDKFQQFDSTKAAVRFMQSCPDLYSQQDIDHLESKIYTEVKKLTPDKYVWKDDDPNLPPGWKSRSVMCSNGLERHFFLAPDGSSYSGRKQAIDYMKKNKFKPEDIRTMEGGLQVKWIDNDPDLPAGWKTRMTDMKTKTGVIPMQWYLSPQDKMFRGKKSALEHITNCGLYTREDIRKFRCSGNNIGNKTGYDWDDKDDTVPPGWKTTVISVNSFGKMVQSKRFLSPDGRFCSSRIDALKYMLKENIFKEEDMRHMKDSLVQEGWETDTLLPPGWLIKPDKQKECEATFNYLSPDFQFLRSTRAAQTFMQNSNLYTDEDVRNLGQLIAEEKRKIRMDRYGSGKSPIASRRQSECTGTSPRASALFESSELQEMRNSLNSESWETSELLPAGWRLQRLDDTDVVFQSNSGTIFDSFESALEDIETPGKNTEQTVVNFKKLCEELKAQSTQNSGKFEWNDNDPTIAYGWKSRTVEGKLKRTFFLSPDGSVYACRRSCLHHMIKEKYPEEEIEEMRKLLVHEGWNFEDYLPSGWMVRKTEGMRDGAYDVDFWLLNVQGTVFRSTKTAIEFLTNSEEYTQEDVDRLTAKLEAERRKARILKYDWIDGDESLPDGWKLRHVDGKSARKTFFLSADGFQFACRRSAYVHMIKENYSSEQLDQMRDKMRYEGWETDPLLPDKWVVKKSEGSTNGMYDVNYSYFSKEGVVFHSTKAVIAHMTASTQYTEEDIAKIRSKLEIETRKNRPQRYDWLEDENLPPGWKYRTIVKAGIRTDFILTDEGHQFQSRRAAIEHLVKENADPQVIFKMWSTLDTEGWITDDHLPKGWRVRSKDRLKDNWQFYFLSPQMEVFKSHKTVLDHIGSNKDMYSDEDLQCMKQWIEDEQKQRREKNYDWSEEKILPPGWKVRTVITNSKNIREFFLTPDGSQIAGRRKAIEAMREAGASKSILDQQTRKMKLISTKNSTKVVEDFVQASSPKKSSAPASSSNHDASLQDYNDIVEEDLSHDFYSDDDHIVLAEDDGEEENPHEISLEGMIPEFEPVEISAMRPEYDQQDQVTCHVDVGDDDDDIMIDDDFDEDDEFNDVEEITDDTDSITVENIRIEPDIIM